ncbi:hypothetical protein BDN72DRAFT_887852 [Pluteus cervinus]|uniref:Uncharacterized protein n=1 Tax=Pluteus cervinus TaxID=181527 RepID=A0ACD3AZJ5_9AGAR|nr:hypothetical protein BDN72DRAFT_887852 [Pluteus cervinus]
MPFRSLGLVYGQDADSTADDQLMLSQTLGPKLPTSYVIWLDTLTIPIYAAVVSASLLLISLARSSRAYEALCATLFNRTPSSSDDESSERSIRSASFVDGIQHNISQRGGLPIFVCLLLRLLGCIVLLSLSIAPAIISERDASHGFFNILGKQDKEPKNPDDEWLELAMFFFYLYMTVLATISVAGTAKWSRRSSCHLAILLLVTFGVYFYRDLFPFATYNRIPLDAHEGRALWAKISLLFFVGVAIPLGIPRRYVPVDAKQPSSKPSPDQTASLFSLMTYSFLDPLVWSAYRVPKLDKDQFLPRLADCHHGSVLKAKSFPHFDVSSGAGKRHIFFGILRVFGRDYLIMAIMTIVRVFLAFTPPLAINRVLRYLETGGEDTFIRPWFWISLLFIGPVMTSLSFQWYIYVGNRVLVRVECILSELIFEHALRIRVKASTADLNSDTLGSDTSDPTTPSNQVPTPEDTPLVGRHDSEETLTDEQPNADPHFLQETLRGSNVHNGKSGKGKDTQKGTALREGSQSMQVPDSLKRDESGDNVVGKINNLVTTDLANVVGSNDFIQAIIEVPIQISLCIAFLHAILGWSAFVGLATIVVLLPIPGYIAKQVQRVQRTRLKKSDARVQSITEVMNVIRMVKLFGWERRMNERVAEKREEELIWIWKRLLLNLATTTTNIYAINLLSSTIIMKQQLSASTVFSSMSVLDTFRDRLQFAVNYYATQIMTGKVSLDRINNFLHNTELLDSFSGKTPELTSREAGENPENKFGFKNATFSWTSDSSTTGGSSTPSTRNFLLKVEDEVLFQQGRVNLIVGPTGSGKTSLLMALLGEMHYIPSTPESWYNLPRTGGIAYAAQESWIQNETIRDNIIFGSPYDEVRYKKVIHQCALEKDLQLFDAGDQTEVGEKGLTLSGGQKARVTLARAVYSQAKTLLLDDIFAALDVHTAKWIIDKCFGGDLVIGRTVLLVTHNVALALPVADYLISLSIDGRVVSSGPVSAEIAKNRALKEEVEEEQAVLDPHNSYVDPPAPGVESKADGKLIVAEEIQEGHLSWKALKLHLSAMGGSHPLLFFAVFVLGLALTKILNTLQTWYLGHWASQYDGKKPEEVDALHYVGFYGLLLSISCITLASAFVVYVFGALRASRELHRQLVEAVLGTTLRWLDTTPVSRVITRCTQDIQAVDGPIAIGLWVLSEMTVMMLAKFIAVIIFTPAFFVPGIVAAAIGGWVGQIYIAAQLAVKREASNAKAPILGHIGAAISGLTSIRAYGVQSRFIEESLNRIDRYTRSRMTFFDLNRWICLRIDVIGSLFSSTLAVYLVYFQNQNASNTGFTLNMAVGFSGMILWWVRNFNSFEVQGNSLERIQGYISIEQEPKPTNGDEPPAYWPASGDLRVENLSARYSPDGPKILHGLSFKIKSGERIGVVGRTGSGKSSLTLSLLRCIFTEGEVYYDGLKTSAINLDALRSKITIIPQVPELLSGPLRYNLDPFDQYDDATLNDALRAAGLFDLQNDLDKNRITLDTAISSGGSNLSVGQRQILALARAIVRGSKLSILDEATSAIDFKTDSIIQSSLRHELKGDVTLIIIAHRLQTIMDADRVMVLDAGRIAEFDSPKNLLQNDKGRLRALVDESSDRAELYSMSGS